MSNLELPLILFTLLSQMAIGMAMVSAVRQWAVVDGPTKTTRTEWLVIGLLLAGAIVASLFHLGYPLGAIYTLTNLQQAWMSREILGIIAFGLLVAVIFFTEVSGTTKGWLLKLVAVVGLATIFATSMTYASPPSLPAINNALPFAFFLLSAIVLGAGFGSYFAGPAHQPLLYRILVNALIVSLAINLLVPCLWLSGGVVMRQTGLNYLQSPLYWVQVVVGLVVPLLVLWRTRRIPAWLPILLLVGEVAGRMAFFVLNASTVSNIGNLF
jgi:DMSO reductase anchor subunit